MRTTPLKGLLSPALRSAARAQAADDVIQMAFEDGKPIAQFKVGDSSCVLVDGQIRCTPNK